MLAGMAPEVAQNDEGARLNSVCALNAPVINRKNSISGFMGAHQLLQLFQLFQRLLQETTVDILQRILRWEFCLFR
jgi:hypothetical protein